MNILNPNLIIKLAISLGIILFCKMFSSGVAYILIKIFHFKEKNRNKIKNNENCISKVELFKKLGFLDKKEAVILLLATVFYMGFNVWHGKNTNSKDEKDEKDKKEKNSKNKTKDEDRLTLKSFFTIIFLIAIGGLMLNFGSDFVIDGATYIAKELRVTAEVISLTIIVLKRRKLVK